MIFQLVACSVLATASVSAQRVPDALLHLKDLYQKKVKESIEPLQNSFIQNLDDLEKRLAAQRKLEEALVVREERVRIAIDPLSKSDLRVVSQSAELKRVMEIYERHLESRVRPVRAIYLTALKRLESKLIGERELTEALKIRKEIKVIEAEYNAPSPIHSNIKLPKENVALASAGATAIALKGALYLIDGVTKGHTQKTGYAWGGSRCEFVVKLAKQQQVSQVRVYFWDGEKGRKYKYKLYVSRRGDEDWVIVADRLQSPGHGWQQHDFDPRTVRAVKVVGFGNTDNSNTQIVEIEVR
jgi:hypothetical protein